jgi:hypothetical protein
MNLAPNGKPSNLTPEQYTLVRTPAFKRWFGDWENSPETASKVVDGNGEPLVVFHGTTSTFNIFKNDSKGSRGGLNEKFWSFTTNVEQALVYALDKRLYGNFSEPRIIPVFLNIREMPTYDNEGRFYRELKVWGGYKYIDIFQLQDWHDRGFDMGVEFKKVDGFCVKNTIEMEDLGEADKTKLVGDTYYVRNSNQIKLADGSNTTFDGGNPDIRYAEGGYTSGFEIATKKNDILKYLTRNSERYTDRDLQELNELFDNGVYVEQDQKVISDIIKSYKEFYITNPSFRKIPLVIYENTTKRGFGEGHTIEYDFLQDLFVFSSKKGYHDIIKTKTVPINDTCGFVYEKYQNKLIGAFMHEYGHYVNSSNVPYIDKDWHSNNWAEIGKISLYAQENRAEYLAEAFALKNIINYNELSQEIKDFVKENYEDKIPKNKLKYKKGGYTRLAKTPAPKSERIYGSKTNKPKSSASSSSAKSITFSEDTLQKIKNKVSEHNEKYPNKKITVSVAKAVVRRGMGAYSSTHRPTIKGGKPNSRVAWGLARLNAFIHKAIHGTSKSGKYNQDDDLFNELGIGIKSYENGGKIDTFVYTIGGL